MQIDYDFMEEITTFLEMDKARYIEASQLHDEFSVNDNGDAVDLLNKIEHHCLLLIDKGFLAKEKNGYRLTYQFHNQPRAGAL